MVKLYEDSGSFDRILREAEEAAKGDESLKLSLLTRKIVQDLVDQQMQASAAASLLIMKGEEEVFTIDNSVGMLDNLSFHISKRRRSTVIKNFPRKPSALPQLPPQVLNKRKKITLNICFHQTQNSGKEEEEEDVVRKPKRQRREKKKGNSGDQEQVPDLPELFKHRIQQENGTDVVLVMQKHITESDLKKNLNRLSIPRNQIRAVDFLTEEEKKIAEDKKQPPIEVRLIPPSLKENVKLNLKRWTMGNSYVYNLNDNWYSCVVKDADNRLEVGSLVQLWSYRKNITDLCFALVKVE